MVPDPLPGLLPHRYRASQSVQHAAPNVKTNVKQNVKLGAKLNARISSPSVRDRRPLGSWPPG